MSGDIAAAADVITGALVARTVEPHQSGGSAHGAAPGLCLNCGTRLIGSHCHVCGQSGHVHRTVGAIGHEIAHGVFHFEGKIWRTLPLLILRPGELTRRYVNGERVRFVSPLALFLFTVFLMFATISAVGGELSDKVNNAQGRTAQANTSAQLAEARKALDLAEAQHAATVKAGDDPTGTDATITALRATIKALEFARRAKNDAGTGPFADVKTGWARLDHGIEKANANPSLALYKLQSSAYKYSWLLIPISTPFVALLFLWRRRFGLYDHAVFVTYSLSFMMLLVITVTWLAAWGVSNNVWGSMLAFWPPLHMFQQLRGAYALRKRSALWRTIALLVFSNVAMLLFVTLLLLHGLAE